MADAIQTELNIDSYVRGRLTLPVLAQINGDTAVIDGDQLPEWFSAITVVSIAGRDITWFSHAWSPGPEGSPNGSSTLTLTLAPSPA